MRATKRYLTSIVAILALVVGQLIPGSSAFAAGTGPSIVSNQFPTIGFVDTAQITSDGSPRVWGNDRTSTLRFTNNGIWTTDQGAPTFSNSWYRCPSKQLTGSITIPDTCELIDGATSTTYKVSQADAGRHIVGAITATDLEGQSTAYSASTEAVASAPTFQESPSLRPSGELVVGNSISSSSVVWSAIPAPIVTTQWFACSSRVPQTSSTLATGCSPITGATAAVFTPTNVHKGKFLVYGTTAKNSATGTTLISTYSASTETSVTPAPQVAATVLGTGSTVKFTQASTAKLNSKFTVGITGWVTATTYTYKWYRCDYAVQAGLTAPVDCDEIIGATANSYSVTAADVDKYVTSYVVAKSGTNQVAAVRTASRAITMQSPTNTAAATLLGGLPVVGRSLTAVNGSWLSSPSANFTYQWYSCSAAVVASATKNAACNAITGAVDQTFVILENQAKKFLVVQVKATNSTGTSSIFSASSSVVMSEPANTAAPVISSSQSIGGRNPIVGATLNVTPGTWSGSPTPTRTYEWYSCSSAVAPGSVTLIGLGCELIPEATGTTLAVTVDLQGKFVTVAESATNPAATSISYAGSQYAVQTKPLFSGDPSISGTANSGNSISVTSGASSVGGPATESYAWAKCSAAQSAGALFGLGCSQIAGEAESTLEITRNLEGSYLVARVTLTNAAGSTTRTSASTSRVTGLIQNVELGQPTSSKNPVQIGAVVTANDGTWTGFPLPTFSYQWLRCPAISEQKSDSQGDNCVEISGATQKTLSLTTSDAGRFVAVKVTATQGANTVSIFSPTTEQVLEAPTFIGQPSVGGQHVVDGSRLVTIIGGKRGVSDPVATYVWYRCNNRVLVDSPTVPSGCSIIAGSSSSSYEFVTADVGKYVLAAITLTNELGSAKRFSSSSEMVNIAPSNLTLNAPVSATQPPTVGVDLTANPGTWAGNPQPTFRYSWFRCDALISSKSEEIPLVCSSISGANRQTYTPVQEDSEKFLMVSVTGTTEYGFETVYSPTTVDVSELPKFVRGPLLSASRNKGEDISLSVAEIRGWNTPTSTYRWFRCQTQVEVIADTIPSGCVVINKATAATYTITQADVQKYLVLEVKIKNRVGTLTRYTPSTLQIRQAPEIAQTAVVTGKQWNGQTLTATGVSVSGFPTPVVSVNWFRCLVSACTMVQANSLTYNLTVADRGASVYFVVNASNEAGSDSSNSGLVGPIKRTPTLVGNSSPSVFNFGATLEDLFDKEVRATSELTADAGAWDALPIPDDATGFSYQWYRCEVRQIIASATVPLGCAIMPGETSSTYRTKFTDAGKFIAFGVTVKNGTQDASYFSSSTARVYVVPEYKIGAKPSFATGQAATDGSPRVGYQVEATVGTWQGTPTPTYSYQWFSCDAAVIKAAETLGEACSEIPDATARTFNITSAQIGKYLGVNITGSYKSNSDEIYSPTTLKSVVSPPVNISPPRITNNFTYVQSTLKTTDGTWEATPAPTQTHTWWECTQPVLAATSNQPSGCSELPNSSGTWKVTDAQVGKYISSMVTSSNAAGTSRIWSASTEQLKTGAVNLVAPTISIGLERYPSTKANIVISSDGSWVGSPDPAWTAYNWYRCPTKVSEPSDGIDGSCDQILLNASGASYAPVAADVGKYLVASVTYESLGQGASVAFAVSTEQIYQPPNNLTAPTVPLAAFVDREVTSDLGTWEGLPIPDYTFQWFACDSRVTQASANNPGCTAISGATASTFTPTDALLEKFLVLAVKAENKVGSQTFYSASTNAVVSGPVLKTAPTFNYPNTATTPATNKNPLVGQSFSTNGGIWKGFPAPTFTYEWFVCPQIMTASTSAPAEDKNCIRVEGAQANTFTPVETQRGKFLIVHIHATNENGEADYYSASTSAIWMAPVVETEVVAWGTGFNLLNVKAKGDTWRAFPEIVQSNKTYAWYVCATQVNQTSLTLHPSCASTPIATTQTYKLPAADWNAGKYLIAKLKVANSAGSYEYFSASSNVIRKGPVNTVAPKITGEAKPLFVLGASKVLAVNSGTWDPSAATISYQWYRCNTVQPAFDELDPTCVAILDATTNSYTLSERDPGKALLVGVTGTSDGLSSTTYSASTPQVLEKVRNVIAPTTSGIPKVGESSTGSNGEWRGFPVPTLKKQWYACTSRTLETSFAKPLGCTLLPGATSENQLNGSDLIGKYLVYAVSGTNTTGKKPDTVTVFSASTEAVADPPRFASKPELIAPADFTSEEGPSVGTEWGVRRTWTNTIVPAETFQWYRCDQAVDTQNADIVQAPEGCVAIGEATGEKYTVRLDDRNKFIMVAVTGTNSVESFTRFTNTTLTSVGAAPEATVLPSVSGGRNVGSTLTANPGEWQDPQPTITYQWYSCSAPILTTTNVIPSRDVCTLAGGTGNTYTIDAFDAAESNYITVLVTASGGTNPKAVTSYLVAVTQASEKAPTLIAPPRIYGDAFIIGATVVVKDDEWDAQPAPEKTYQWYFCDTEVRASSTTLASGCVEIPNATSEQYVVSNAADNKYLLVKIVATNSSGSATVYSPSTDGKMIAGYESGDTPVSVTASGTAISPNNPITLTFQPGNWTKAGVPQTNMVLVHRWIFCTAPILEVQSRMPASCDFVNLTSTPLHPSDLGSLTLGMDTYFAGYYISSIEYVFEPLSPADRDRPNSRKGIRISKSTERITIAPRLWTDAGVSPGTQIYVAPTVTAASKVGDENRVNQAFNWQSDTDPFSNSLVPRVTWRGVGTSSATLEYQWFSCTAKVSNLGYALPAGCDFISGANAVNYTPVAADRTKFLGVAITATNSAGSIQVFTKTSEKTTMAPVLESGSSPTLSDVSFTQQTVSIANGTWLAEPAATFTYKWMFCDSTSPGPGTSAVTPAACTVFTPIENRIPTMGGRNLHRKLFVQVIATNRPYFAQPLAEASNRASVSTVELQELPWFNSLNPVELTSSPTVSTPVAANVGETITMTNDINRWAASPVGPSGNLSFEYSWYDCGLPHTQIQRDSRPANDCELIVGETSKWMALTHAHAGKRIMGFVKATSSIGEGFATTAQNFVVGEKPYIDTLPTINTDSGQPRVGSVITATPGTFLGETSPSLDTGSYQWFACDTQVSASATKQPGCTQILTPTPVKSISPTRDTRGKYLVFSNSASNTINPSVSATTRHYSAAVGPVLMAPEFSEFTGGSWVDGSPVISLAPHVGQTITTSLPKVTAYPNDSSVSFDWYSCPSLTLNDELPNADSCLKIGTTNSPSLLVEASMRNRYIEVFAVATNSVGTTRNNTTTLKPTTMSPLNDSAPSISGTFVGNGTNRATGTAGSWTSAPGIDTKSYSWLLCTTSSSVSNSKPAGCDTPAVLTTAASPGQLTITRDMAGKFLVLQETVTQSTNNLGANKSGTIFSASSPVITSSPQFDAEPSISGTRHVGQVLTLAKGTVSGFPAPSVSIQWLSCNTAVTNKASVSTNGCINIGDPQDVSSLASVSLTISSAQADKFISARVTATNDLATVTTHVLSGALKVTQSPTLNSAPTISGDTQVGDARNISVSQGSWTAFPAISSRSFSWYHCATETLVHAESVESDCTLITGSNGAAIATNSINLKSEYRGRHIVAVETVSNSTNLGTVIAKRVTSSMGPIGMAPVFNSTPTFTGTLHVGETVSAGLPLASVTAFPNNSTSYDWYACNNPVSVSSASIPAGCALQVGQGGADLVIGSNLAGKYIMLVLSNTNTYGTAIKTSLATTDVTATLVNTGAAAISGDTVVGAPTPLLVSQGSWTSSPLPVASDYQYSWYQCNLENSTAPVSKPADCTLLTGNAYTAQTLNTSNSMAGKFIMASVTVTVRTNKAGSGTKTIFTSAVGPIRTKPLFLNGAPTISGIAHLGQNLTATPVLVSGYDSPTSSYSWWSCSSAISSSVSDVSGDCTLIDGAEGTTLNLSSNIVGQRVVFVQTGTNGQGSVSKSSITSEVVTSTPVLTSSPVISGSSAATAAATVSVSKGVWSGHPAPAAGTYTYAWYRCPTNTNGGNSITGCTLIAGATSVTLPLTNEFGGQYLAAKVTVTTTTNLTGAGTATTFSAGFGPIRTAPTNTAAPSFSPTSIVTGNTITANVGSWSDLGSNAPTYRWYSCLSTYSTSSTGAVPGACSPIANFDNTPLVVPSTLATRKILLIVTATNSVGSTIRTSSTSSVVTKASISALFLRAVL